MLKNATYTLIQHRLAQNSNAFSRAVEAICIALSDDHKTTLKSNGVPLFDNLSDADKAEETYNYSEATGENPSVRGSFERVLRYSELESLRSLSFFIPSVRPGMVECGEDVFYEFLRRQEQSGLVEALRVNDVKYFRQDSSTDYKVIAQKLYYPQSPRFRNFVDAALLKARP